MLNNEETLLTDYQKLVAFFDAIDYVVTIVVETQVTPFVDQISVATSAPLTLGGYSMTEFTSIVCARLRYSSS
jgi:hypothetical protein